MPIVIANPTIPVLTYWDVANTASNYTIDGALVTNTSGFDEFGIISLTGVTTGKHYVELTFNTPSGAKGLIGLADSTANPNIRPSSTTRTGWYMYMDRLQRVYFDSVLKETGLGDQMPVGTFTMGIKVDMDNFQMGLLDSTGANMGAGPWSSLPATEIKIAAGVGAIGETVTANFGQSAFSYSVPGGFNPGWPGYF